MIQRSIGRPQHTAPKCQDTTGGVGALGLKKLVILFLLPLLGFAGGLFVFSMEKLFPVQKWKQISSVLETQKRAKAYEILEALDDLKLHVDTNHPDFDQTFDNLTLPELATLLKGDIRNRLLS